MKRLYKPKDEGMFLGVCAGIAEYLDLDPTIVRLIAIAFLIIFDNLTVLAIYFLIAFLMPDENDIKKKKKKDKKDKKDEKLKKEDLREDAF